MARGLKARATGPLYTRCPSTHRGPSSLTIMTAQSSICYQTVAPRHRDPVASQHAGSLLGSAGRHHDQGGNMGKTVAIKLAAVVLGLSMGLGIVASTQASQPPGLRGYEGQPGNQGGGNHHP